MGQDIKSETIVTVRPIYYRSRSDDSTQSATIQVEKEFEVRSQDSSAISVEDDEAVGTTRWYRRGGARRWMRWRRLDSPKTTRRRLCCQWTMIVFVVVGFFFFIAAIIYVSFLGALLSRLAPSKSHSGLDRIVEQWKEPDARGAYLYEWKDDFSRDIVPKNCHSHNDYWRRVPLYAAFAAGCTGIEADVWLTEDNDLLVGHSWSSTRTSRTLRTLYLDPLANIFEHRNVSTASASAKETGFFDADPNTSVTLLIDFKSNGHDIWPVLLEQLQTFRDRNWLTYYDGKTLNQGPLTIVGTGSTPFELVQQNSTNRFIFYDAPLRSISEPQYNSTNSYYASAKLKAVIGMVWLGKFSSKQENTLKQQIQAAEDKGLKSRYYGTPAWPISARDNVWARLMDFNVGMLNVDDLVSATKWNWGFCVVAGIALCGNS